MSQENVDIVQAHFDATTRRDFTLALDAFDEDVLLVVEAGLVPTAAGAFHGRGAVGEWFGDWLRSFAEDYRFEIDDIRSIGEQVFVVARHHGRGRASGIELDWSVAYVYTVRTAKIVRVELFRDQETALEAVGLAE